MGDRHSAGFMRAYPRNNNWGWIVFSCVAMSHDGKLLQLDWQSEQRGGTELHNERGIKVYDVASGRLLYSLDGHEGDIGAVTFSADGQFIISASYDGTIIYWSRSTKRKVLTLTAGSDGRWTALSEMGFFAGSQPDSDFWQLCAAWMSL